MVEHNWVSYMVVRNAANDTSILMSPNGAILFQEEWILNITNLQQDNNGNIIISGLDREYNEFTHTIEKWWDQACITIHWEVYTPQRHENGNYYLYGDNNGFIGWAHTFKNIDIANSREIQWIQWIPVTIWSGEPRWYYPIRDTMVTTLD